MAISPPLLTIRCNACRSDRSRAFAELLQVCHEASRSLVFTTSTDQLVLPVGIITTLIKGLPLILLIAILVAADQNRRRGSAAHGR